MHADLGWHWCPHQCLSSADVTEGERPDGVGFGFGFGDVPGSGTSAGTDA
jgi:hypothetical protein